MMNFVNEEFLKRFWKKIKTNKNGCWEWIGKKRSGYGRMVIQRKDISVHRIAYFIFKGKFDEKKYVLHRCNNTCCINPDHLFLGDQNDNMKHMVSCDRQDRKFGERNPACSITEKTARFIKINEDKLANNEMAVMCDCSRSIVFNIRHNRTWTHLY